MYFTTILVVHRVQEACFVEVASQLTIFGHVSTEPTLYSHLTLYCVYTMFPAAPAAPFARNVACRGVLVIYFSDFQDLLRFVTFSYVVLRYP